MLHGACSTGLLLQQNQMLVVIPFTFTLLGPQLGAAQPQPCPYGPPQAAGEQTLRTASHTLRQPLPGQGPWWWHI